MSTLKHTFTELLSHEWDGTEVSKYYDVAVIQEYHTIVNPFGHPVKAWPGKHKYVFAWVLLANGKAVAWNENPSKGWSFPVVTFKE